MPPVGAMLKRELFNPVIEPCSHVMEHMIVTIVVSLMRIEVGKDSDQRDVADGRTSARSPS